MSGRLFEFTSCGVDAIRGSPVSANSFSSFPAVAIAAADDNGIKLSLDIAVSQLNAVAAVAFGVHIICEACNTP